MARKISQFSEYTWDEDTFAKAYIPIIAPPENENNVIVVNEENTNEEDIYKDYINYKFKPIEFFLSKNDSYNQNSLIITDSSGKITFKECVNNKYLFIDGGGGIQFSAFDGDKVLLSKNPGLIEESAITTTQLNYLSGIKNNIQTQLDSKLPKSFSTSTAANKVVITDDSKNIVTSTDISTTELNYLNGVSSNIQTQLNTKAAINSPNFTGTPIAPTPDIGTINNQIATTKFVDDLIAKRKPVISTAERVIISDSNKNIIASDVTTTELNYLKGTTSKIQDQLNSKLPSVLSGNNTDSKVLITNSSKLIGASSITTTELSYLQGVSSKIQTQLNAKQAKNVGKAYANMVLVTDSDGNIATSSKITTTELEALNGFATSSGTIQAQLDNKASKTSKYIDYANFTLITTGGIATNAGVKLQRVAYTATEDTCVIVFIKADPSNSDEILGQILFAINNKECDPLRMRVYGADGLMQHIFLKSGDVLNANVSSTGIVGISYTFHRCPWG